MTSTTPSDTPFEAPLGRIPAALGLAAAAALLAGGYRLFRTGGSRLLAAGAWAAAAALAYGATGRWRAPGKPAQAGGGADHPPVTQAIVPRTPAGRDLGEPGRNAEQRLDEAVEETFPASDPIAVHIE